MTVHSKNYHKEADPDAFPKFPEAAFAFEFVLLTVATINKNKPIKITE